MFPAHSSNFYVTAIKDILVVLDGEYICKVDYAYHNCDIISIYVMRLWVKEFYLF